MTCVQLTKSMVFPYRKEPMAHVDLHERGLIETLENKERKSHFFSKKIDKVCQAGSVLNQGVGVFQGAVQAARGVEVAIQGKKASRLSSQAFAKVWTIVCIPFSFISGLLSAYFAKKELFAFKESYENRDEEGLKEHGVGFIGNMTDVAGSSTGGAAGIQALKGGALVGLLSILATSLATAVFFIYTALQIATARRCYRALKQMKTIFHICADGEKEVRKLEQLQVMMAELAGKIGLNVSEERKIQEKTGDFNHGEAFWKEANKKMIAKEKKLERRVGEETMRLIKRDAYKLSQELQSDDLEKRKLAIENSVELLKTYKRSLYKKFFASAVGIAAGVLGTMAGIILLANPVGAMIAAGTLFAVSFSLILYALIGEHTTWRDCFFDRGFSLFGHTFSNIKIADAPLIFKQEEAKKIQNEMKQVPHLQREKIEAIDEEEISDFLRSVYHLIDQIENDLRKKRVSEKKEFEAA